MNQKKALVLGTLELQPVPPPELAEFRRTMEQVTLPKIKADVQRQHRAVAVARQYVAR